MCFKTGNATILRGGSEAIHSNVAIAAALAKAGAPEHAIQLIPFTDRESVAVLAGMDQWLDLIIPRGGKGLIETVVSLARMPVIKHYDGICHLFADKAADLDMAVDLTVNSKTQKCGVCNALETLLVHREIAASFLPKVAAALRAKNVQLRGCAETRHHLTDITPATEEDWSTEYLDLILSIKIVGSLEEAVSHINQYGSHHTDVIVTADHGRGGTFPALRRFRLCFPQRLHPLRRRRRVRLRRGNRHLHRQTPRPRPDGLEGTHQLSIPGERKRAGEGVNVCRWREQARTDLRAVRENGK